MDYTSFFKQMIGPLWISWILITLIVQFLLVRSIKSIEFVIHYGKVEQEDAKKQGQNPFIKTLHKILKSTDFPKSYFTHYYIFFTGALTVTGVVLPNLSQYPGSTISRFLTGYYETFLKDKVVLSESNYINVHIVYALLFIQSTRRLYESLFVSKFGTKSRIGFLIYVFGIFYYFLVASNNFLNLLPYYIEFQQYLLTGQGLLQYLINNKLVIVYITVFLLAAIDQHQNHIHLSQLIKYSTPSFRLFQYSSSAHYFDEILVYVLVFLISYQKYSFGEKLSPTDFNFLVILLFVIGNLSVTAIATRDYYLSKFKDYQVKWSIIPGILWKLPWAI